MGKFRQINHRVKCYILAPRNMHTGIYNVMRAPIGEFNKCTPETNLKRASPEKFNQRELTRKREEI
jgi:hypothetical protein